MQQVRDSTPKNPGMHLKRHNKAAKEAGADLDAAALKDLATALEKAQASLKIAITPNPNPTPDEKKLAAPTIKSVKASAAKAGVVVKVIVNAVEGADHYDIYRTVNGKTVLRRRKHCVRQAGI